MTAMPVSSASPHSGHRSRLRQRLAREPLAVADYEILELARTGLTGLERGSEDIRVLP